MSQSVFFRSILICFSLGLLFCWGCASSPQARFYTLSSLSAPLKDQTGQPLGKGLTIGLGPIRFPDYLDRPGIVTRRSGNTIEIAEFDLWAGSLKDDFLRVLAENISILLETDKIVLYPYIGAIPIDFRIGMNLNRFEGTPGDQALLEATWAILEGPDKKDGVVRKSRITEPAPGSDYQSLVAAQSRAVERLGREIVQAIQALPAPAAAK
ncbi:MAG: membrane integrity-associated transporter subunit PqiC [Deltaproteobacteria bacterium]|nr:membrane integrity-associated transporter subunit PqiC [Deltaproteobacteria bacterium]